MFLLSGIKIVHGVEFYSQLLAHLLSLTRINSVHVEVISDQCTYRVSCDYVSV